MDSHRHKTVVAGPVANLPVAEGFLLMIIIPYAPKTTMFIDTQRKMSKPQGAGNVHIVWEWL